jgi:platelet-activating factor acetylhydrolase IB subunit alpha
MSIFVRCSQVMDLEARIEQLNEELKSVSSGKGSTRPKGDITDMLPRSGAQPKHVLQGHRDPITAVRLHPVFNLAVTCSEDTTIKVWDYESGQFERTLKGHTDAVQDIAFNEQGTRLVSCSSDLSVKVWEFEQEFVCQKSMYGHDHSVSSIVCVPATDLAVSSSRDKSIKVWDIASGYCVRTLEGHDNWVRRVRVSPCGSTLVSAAADQTVKVWQLKTGACTQTLRPHEHVVDCLAFSNAAADAVLLAHANSSSSTVRILILFDSSIHLSHNCYHWRRYQAPAASIAAPAAVGVGGQFIATGSRDKSIRITRVDSGAVVMTLTGHDNWVRGVLFHAGGRYLLSCSDDKSIRVWDLSKQGRCVRRYDNAHPMFVTAIEMSVGGKNAAALLSVGADSSLRVWSCE